MAKFIEVDVAETTNTKLFINIDQIVYVGTTCTGKYGFISYNKSNINYATTKQSYEELKKLILSA